MNNFCFVTIFSRISPFVKNDLVDGTLTLQLRRKQKSNCLLYGGINLLLFGIIGFDLNLKCPFSESYFYYLEYAAAVLLALSATYYYLTWLYYKLGSSPLHVTEAQRKLLGFNTKDGSFIVSPEKISDPVKNQKDIAPMNISQLSWQSTSYNDPNLSMGSSSWMYNKGSQSFENSTFNITGHPQDSSFKHYNNTSDIITEEKELKQYLKHVTAAEEINMMSTTKSMEQTGTFASFWNNYRFNDLTALLRTSLYQLSPTPAVNAMSMKPKDDLTGGIGKELTTNSEELRKIPSDKLSAYVANLRMWISETILQRLVKEADNVNETLRSRGFSDTQIGVVGLERLKKTAENLQLVSLHIPTLPMLIPFLEITTNQEYLFHRIRDLANGKCIADYRWNSGASYNKTPWDDHLPTDAAILFHIFSTYLDGQLMPLPDRSRPFYNRYVIVVDSKKPQREILNEMNKDSKCAILCTNMLKPKMNFISDGKIHNCAFVSIYFIFV